MLADGEKCAVKSFKKNGLSEKRRGDLKNEALFMPRRLHSELLKAQSLPGRQTDMPFTSLLKRL